MISRIKDFYKRYVAKINIYWLVGIVFFVLTFVVGDSNIYNRYLYDQKIKSLEKEIKACKKEIEVNSQKLKSLRTDKDGLEKFAREEYFMKRADEDVFIIKDE